MRVFPGNLVARRSVLTLAAVSGLLAARPAAATTYAVDFVANAATGVAMNEAGDVVGYAYAVDTCGPWCLPDYNTVVWVAGEETILPDSSSTAAHYVTGMNADGWISGYANFDSPLGIVWKPSTSGYEVIEIGAMSDTTYSDTMGIDDAGRVLGWTTTGGAIPTAAGAYVWTEADGMQYLGDVGFPDQDAWAISPGGTVATQDYWYSLDDAATINTVTTTPSGYVDYGYGAVINDAGEQARFLLTTSSSSSYVYGYRYHTDGTWASIGANGSYYYSYGFGSINDAGDVTGGVSSTAFIAYGPDGTAQGLASMVSTAYPSPSLTLAGDMNSSGDILAQMAIGASYRLVKLTPVTACTSNCTRVSRLTIRSRFVQDPTRPGSCIEGGTAYNSTTVNITVTSETGAVVRNATVYGRFLDSYYTNTEVSGRTNARGQLTLANTGNCGVGTVAFLVDDVVSGTRTLDRTTGTLAASVVPR